MKKTQKRECKKESPEEDAFDVGCVEEGRGRNGADSVVLQVKELKRLGQVRRNV